MLGVDAGLFFIDFHAKYNIIDETYSIFHEHIALFMTNIIFVKNI